MAIPVLVTAGRKIAHSAGVNANSITINTPDSIQVGDLLVAFISLQTAVTTASALQMPGGWTRLDTYTSGQRGVCIAVKPLRTGGDVTTQPASQTWSNIENTANARFAGAIYRVTGADLDVPLAAQSGIWPTLAASDTAPIRASPSTMPPHSSLGIGMFYAHSSSAMAAPVMGGSGIVDRITAADISGAATSSLVTFTSSDTARSKVLTVDSGAYAAGSIVQLSIASANPVAPALGMYRVGYSQASLNSMSTSVTVSADSSLQVGDWMLATVSVSAASTGDSMLTPVGWTQLFYEGTGSGTYKTYMFTRQATDTTKNFTFALDTNSVARGLMVSLMWFRGCAPPSQWILSPLWRRDGSPAQQSVVHAPGITTTEPDTLVLSFSVERTSAAETGVASVNGDANEWFFVEQKPNSDANTTLWWGWEEVTTPKTTVDTIVTYPNPQSINAWGVQIGIPALPPPGYPTKYWDGVEVKDARIYIKEAAEYVTPLSVRAVPNPRHTVAKMLATTPFYWAHRGGGDNWPEMSMHAYTQSVLWGVKCLEISVYRTSDGVWVGSHDASTLRVTGQDFDIRTSTWAQIADLTISASATNDPTQPRRPLVKMVDVLATYGRSHVIIIDNKAVERTSEFLDLMEQYDPTHEHLVWKGYRTGTSAPYAAQARGFKTWGYMYDADATNGALDLGCWDILGLNYNATPAEWAAIKAHGKPVVGHVINSIGAAAEALGNHADGLQCSNVKQVIPRIF